MVEYEAQLRSWGADSRAGTPGASITLSGIYSPSRMVDESERPTWIAY